MESGHSSIASASEGRIRFSAHIHISTSGAVEVNYDVTTPERQPEPLPVATIPGIEVIAPARRGGWPRGKSRKAAKRKR
jgi:hypothetical protein